MTIRPATPADEARIRGCARLAFARYVPLIGRRPAPMDADIAAQIAAGEIHVATGAEGELQGYIAFRPVDGVMLLDTVAVHPRAAGQGIGRALVAHCEKAARGLGLTRVRLYTNAAMTANLTLYPRLGYVATGRGTEDGFDRVHFEKTLD
jgi:predicted N-acetyltransferase YhbS